MHTEYILPVVYHHAYYWLQHTHCCLCSLYSTYLHFVPNIKNIQEDNHIER